MIVRRSTSLYAAVLAVAAVGCAKPNAYVAPPPPTVTVAPPVEREITRQLEFTGATRSIEAVDVRARVTGYLQSIEFVDGAQVNAGDVLFVIEPAPYEAALASAEANLQKADATLALARADLARAERLPRGTITEQELDVKRANVATAAADLASANAALRRANLDLSYTQVKAPISGRVSRHLVDVGNLVQPGETILTRVESMDPIHVYFAVSEADVLEFSRASSQSTMEAIRESQPKIYLGLGGEEGFPHEGTLDFAELGVDPETGTQLRRGVFPNPDGKLLPGLFARVRLPIGAPEPGLMVPDRAIATDQRGEYVLVVNDKQSVEYRPVKLGMRIKQMREVLSGVSVTDLVIVNGIQRARPGAQVKPERAAEVPEAKSLDASNDPAVMTPAASRVAKSPLPTGAAGGN